MQQKELLKQYVIPEAIDSNENHRYSVQTGSTLRGRSEDPSPGPNTSTCQNSYNLRYHDPKNNDLSFNQTYQNVRYKNQLYDLSSGMLYKDKRKHQLGFSKIPESQEDSVLVGDDMVSSVVRSQVSIADKISKNSSQLIHNSQQSINAADASLDMEGDAGPAKPDGVCRTTQLPSSKLTPRDARIRADKTKHVSIKSKISTKAKQIVNPSVEMGGQTISHDTKLRQAQQRAGEIDGGGSLEGSKMTARKFRRNFKTVVSSVDATSTHKTEPDQNGKIQFNQGKEIVPWGRKKQVNQVLAGNYMFNLNQSTDGREGKSRALAQSYEFQSHKPNIAAMNKEIVTQMMIQMEKYAPQSNKLNDSKFANTFQDKSPNARNEMSTFARTQNQNRMVESTAQPTPSTTQQPQDSFLRYRLHKDLQSTSNNQQSIRPFSQQFDCNQSLSLSSQHKGKATAVTNNAQRLMMKNKLQQQQAEKTWFKNELNKALPDKYKDPTYNPPPITIYGGYENQYYVGSCLEPAAEACGDNEYSNEQTTESVVQSVNNQPSVVQSNTNRSALPSYIYQNEFSGQAGSPLDQMMIIQESPRDSLIAVRDSAHSQKAFQFDLKKPFSSSIQQRQITTRNGPVNRSIEASSYSSKQQVGDFKFGIQGVHLLCPEAKLKQMLQLQEAKNNKDRKKQKSIKVGIPTTPPDQLQTDPIKDARAPVDKANAKLSKRRDDKTYTILLTHQGGGSIEVGNQNIESHNSPMNGVLESTRTNKIDSPRFGNVQKKDTQKIAANEIDLSLINNLDIEPKDKDITFRGANQHKVLEDIQDSETASARKETPNPSNSSKVLLKNTFGGGKKGGQAQEEQKDTRNTKIQVNLPQTTLEEEKYQKEIISHLEQYKLDSARSKSSQMSRCSKKRCYGQIQQKIAIQEYLEQEYQNFNKENFLPKAINHEKLVPAIKMKQASVPSRMQNSRGDSKLKQIKHSDPQSNTNSKVTNNYSKVTPEQEFSDQAGSQIHKLKASYNYQSFDKQTLIETLSNPKKFQVKDYGKHNASVKNSAALSQNAQTEGEADGAPSAKETVLSTRQTANFEKLWSRQVPTRAKGGIEYKNLINASNQSKMANQNLVINDDLNCLESFKDLQDTQQNSNRKPHENKIPNRLLPLNRSIEGARLSQGRNRTNRHKVFTPQNKGFNMTSDELGYASIKNGNLEKLVVASTLQGDETELRTQKIIQSFFESLSQCRRNQIDYLHSPELYSEKFLSKYRNKGKKQLQNIFLAIRRQKYKKSEIINGNFEGLSGNSLEELNQETLTRQLKPLPKVNNPEICEKFKKMQKTKQLANKWHKKYIEKREEMKNQSRLSSQSSDTLKHKYQHKAKKSQ